MIKSTKFYIRRISVIFKHLFENKRRSKVYYFKYLLKTNNLALFLKISKTVSEAEGSTSKKFNGKNSYLQNSSRLTNNFSLRQKHNSRLDYFVNHNFEGKLSMLMTSVVKSILFNFYDFTFVMSLTIFIIYDWATIVAHLPGHNSPFSSSFSRF